MTRARTLVAFVLALAACSDGKRTVSTSSHFQATTAQAVAVELTGAAQFWCVDRPLKMCAMHLLPEGQDGDSINFTITGSTRPRVGTYAIQPEMDPAGEAFRVNYISGKKGGHQSFVAKSGTVVITESAPTHVTGTFELEGLAVDLVGGVYPLVSVRGSFRSECELHFRQAYTCD